MTKQNIDKLSNLIKSGNYEIYYIEIGSFYLISDANDTYFIADGMKIQFSDCVPCQFVFIEEVEL